MNKQTAFSIALLAALSAALPAAAGNSAITFPPVLAATDLPGGAALWFNSVMRPAGVPLDQPVTICVTHQTLSYKQGRRTITIAVPDAIVQFKPWESSGSASFSDSKWSTSAPSSSAARETFISGTELPVPKGFTPGSITWTASFAADAPGVSLQWRWGAASYAKFTDAPQDLNVVPIDVRHADRAGTPLAFKNYVAGGNDVAQDDFDDLRFTGTRGLAKQVNAEVNGTCASVY